MKVLSYNVNGIRAALGKDLAGFLALENPDVVCLQEIKANPEQFDNGIFEKLGYYTYWNPAQKKGYSGTAILTKTKPDNIVVGCGEQCYDDEGRFIRADFGDLSIASVYLPSGSSGDERQKFKMQFCEFFQPFVKSLLNERKHLVLSGDVNICHHPIDIHNPVSNKKSSGFLPEEREWMSKFLETGLVDSFRYKNPTEQKFSWWSQRFNSRQNNKGWRIDYHLVSNPLTDKIKDAGILNDAVHSDHCPITLELEW